MTATYRKGSDGLAAILEDILDALPPENATNSLRCRTTYGLMNASLARAATCEKPIVEYKELQKTEPALRHHILISQGATMEKKHIAVIVRLLDELKASVADIINRCENGLDPRQQQQHEADKQWAFDAVQEIPETLEPAQPLPTRAQEANSNNASPAFIPPKSQQWMQKKLQEAYTEIAQLKARNATLNTENNGMTRQQQQFKTERDQAVRERKEAEEKAKKSKEFYQKKLEEARAKNATLSARNAQLNGENNSLVLRVRQVAAERDRNQRGGNGYRY